MVGTVIEAADGLSAADRRRAHRDGPWAVAVRTSHPKLFASAGLDLVEVVDVTPEYRHTQAAWLAAWHDIATRAPDLLIGALTTVERIDEAQRSLAAIDGGLLVRRIYHARRPDATRVAV